MNKEKGQASWYLCVIIKTFLSSQHVQKLFKISFKTNSLDYLQQEYTHVVNIIIFYSYVFLTETPFLSYSNCNSPSLLSKHVTNTKSLIEIRYTLSNKIIIRVWHVLAFINSFKFDSPLLSNESNDPCYFRNLQPLGLSTFKGVITFEGSLLSGYKKRHKKLPRRSSFSEIKDRIRKNHC